MAFRVATDDVFGRGVGDVGPHSSFDTQIIVNKTGRLGDEETRRHAVSVSQSPSLQVSKSAFVGLRYASPIRFDRIKVFLARQTEEGGNWAETPRVFILKNPVDTNRTPPENDPGNWLELPSHHFAGDLFTAKPTAAPGAVVEFPLTGSPEEERTGYGWAIGGVKGNGSLAGAKMERPRRVRR